MAFFKFMADWAIWDIIGLILVFIPSIFLLIYLFPRKQIKNLYIDAFPDQINNRYKKVIRIMLTNHTNIPIYLFSEGFTFSGSVTPSPYGAKNHNTEEYEAKFEGRIPNELSEIDTLIRPNQKISTWVPVSNEETNDNICNALKNKNVGFLKLKALKIKNGRDPFVSLTIKI